MSQSPKIELHLHLEGAASPSFVRGLAAEKKAKRIEQAFSSMESWPGVSRTRSLGMVGACDLGGGSGYLADAGWRVFEKAMARGAYLRPLGNVVYVTPSLNISDADLDELLEILKDSVSEVVRDL